MGRTLTNNMTLSVAREQSLGVLGGSPDWKELEPNGLGAWGGEYTTVARNPISRDRQNRKGTVTDLDSPVEYEADLTMDVLDDFADGFVFAQFTNADLFFTESDATATGFSVAALSAAQAGKLQYTLGGPVSLLYARGYATASNNGLKALAADAGETDTELEVSGVVAETAPSKAVVEVAGIRAETGDLSLSITDGVGTLSSGNNGSANPIDFETLGLAVGQVIHVGGQASGNQFSAGYGFARVTAIAEDALTLDKMDGTLVATAGATDTVDLLFGRFLRNVPVDDPAFLEASFQFEAAFPNLMPAGATGYEYARGNLCNEMELVLPLTDKATVNFGFVGTVTDEPTATRATGAADPRIPIKTGALNTSSDIARLRIQDVDEEGLTTDFKSMNITLNNGVTPEKVLGTLGAAYMNVGNFSVTIETQVLFSNPEVVSAIRNNETVAMDFIVSNDDGAVAIDVPAMTLGGGDRELPVNESILLNITGTAFKHPSLNTSIGISFFPIVP